MVPSRGERVVGYVERPDARGQRASRDRERGRCRREQLRGALDTFRRVAEQPAQLADSALGPCVADRGGIGALPGFVDERNHDRRAEHAERGGDHLAGHLTHHAAPTGEVGGAIRQRDSVRVAGALGEPERDVARMAFGREVHLADNRFERRRESAGQS